MGFYMLNLSADSQDPFPQNVRENLSYNDQESIIELVVEKILGYENAFAEHDDSDTEEHNNSKNVKIDLLFHPASEPEQNHLFSDRKQNLYSLYSARENCGYLSTDSPPPNI